MTIDDSAPPTVVSIVGKGRSGTTLLDTILGSLPGFFSLGEVCLEVGIVRAVRRAPVRLRSSHRRLSGLGARARTDRRRASVRI